MDVAASARSAEGAGLNLAGHESKIRFGEGYRERAVLADGTRVLLRPLRPDDAGLLLRGFEHLSSESRYRRFLGFKKTLSPAELKYFTHCDGINHFAIGVVRPDANGEENGVAVARFVRLPSEPTAADVAVTVIDAMQRKGLGRLLVDRLLAAAAERGLKHLRFSVLASNQPMLAILRRLKTSGAPVVDPQIGRGVLQFNLRIPAPAVAGSAL